MGRNCILSLLGVIIPYALASCECGFAANNTNAQDFGLFTDYLETDFFHVKNVTATGWQPQDYNSSSNDTTKKLGVSRQLGNIIANPLADGK